MSDNIHRDFLEELRGDIAALTARIADLDAMLTRERATLAKLSRLEVLVAHRAGVPALTMPEHPRHGDVAGAILGDADRPMRIAEIVEAMRVAGHPLPDDAYAAVHAALARRSRTFKRVARGLWALKDADPRKPTK